MASFAAMAVCEYCGAGFITDKDRVMAMGEMAILVEYPTPFYIHATGRFRGKRFEIAGRLRYRYSRGFWDEWYLRYEDETGAWLVEDEGETSFEKAIKRDSALPKWDAVEPGHQLTLGGTAASVDEKDVARLEGAEGQLPFPITKDREFPYVDASGGEETFTIEYGVDGPEVFQGIWVDAEEFVLDEPKPDEEGGGGWFDA